jgi:two-component system nitrogen regulation sensor histidine kinase GlnL
MMEPATRASDPARSLQIANALPLPLMVVDQSGRVNFVNPAAEQFFDTGAGPLLKLRIADLVPPGSELLQLIEQARLRRASVTERDVDLTTPHRDEKIADAVVSPLPETDGHVVIALQERSLAHRIDRQLLHRGAVRSMNGMAQVLAHEIKNPLAGIRGAAQLLEDANPENARELTELICAEADRIRALIDKMESFGDTRKLVRSPVNIHQVLDRVCRVARSSFARQASFVEQFDPSLPHVPGDADQLIQVFMNLVRNAADSLPEAGGEIVLTTGYRPGVRFGTAISGERVNLPLEVTVRDNGSGIAEDLMPHIFDPFVTTKRGGSGLGLALVAKIVGDHGGVIECESQPRRTVFKVLLPASVGGKGGA